MSLPLIFGMQDVGHNGAEIKAREIKCSILTFLTLVSIATVVTLYIDFFIYSQEYLYAILRIIQAFSLIPIVFLMRRQINKVQPNLAKTKLIIIHLINFLICTVIVVANCYDNSALSINVIEDAFLIYM